MNTQQLEIANERGGNIMHMAVGGTTAVVGEMNGNDWLIVVGIATPIVGLLGNWAINAWFKWQHLKLARQRIRMGLEDHDPEADE